MHRSGHLITHSASAATGSTLIPPSTPGAGGGVTGDNIWQGRGNLSKMIGQHSLKIGGQYHHRQFFTNTSNPMNGDAIFLGGVTGFPMGDALLGYPGEIRRGEGNTLTDGIGRFIMGHRKGVSRFSFRGQVVLK